jgi:hypothetical protein
MGLPLCEPFEDLDRSKLISHQLGYLFLDWLGRNIGWEGAERERMQLNVWGLQAILFRLTALRLGRNMKHGNTFTINLLDAFPQFTYCGYQSARFSFRFIVDGCFL